MDVTQNSVYFCGVVGADIKGTFRRVLEEFCLWPEVMYVSVTNLC